MTIKQFEKWYTDNGACQDGKDFAKGKTLKKVWETCERPDWMMWLYERCKPNQKKAVAEKKKICDYIRSIIKKVSL